MHSKGTKSLFSEEIQTKVKVQNKYRTFGQSKQDLVINLMSAIILVKKQVKKTKKQVKERKNERKE